MHNQKKELTEIAKVDAAKKQREDDPLLRAELQDAKKWACCHWPEQAIRLRHRVRKLERAIDDMVRIGAKGTMEDTVRATEQMLRVRYEGQTAGDAQKAECNGDCKRAFGNDTGIPPE